MSDVVVEKYINLPLYGLLHFTTPFKQTYAKIMEQFSLLAAHCALFVSNKIKRRVA